MRPNNAKFDGKTAFDVVFKPYLHVFGELDLEGYQAEIAQGKLAKQFDTTLKNSWPP